MDPSAELHEENSSSPLQENIAFTVIHELWLWDEHKFWIAPKCCMHHEWAVRHTHTHTKILTLKELSHWNFSKIRKNMAISWWDEQKTHQANCIHRCVAWKLSLAKVKGFLLPPPLSIFFSLRTERKEGRNKIPLVWFSALWQDRNTEAAWTSLILFNLAAHAAKWCNQLKTWQQTGTKRN